jgi:hypothetical protein
LSEIEGGGGAHHDSGCGFDETRAVASGWQWVGIASKGASFCVDGDDFETEAHSVRSHTHKVVISLASRAHVDCQIWSALLNGLRKFRGVETGRLKGLNGHAQPGAVGDHRSVETKEAGERP